MKNKIRARWSKKKNDLIINFPNASDGRYVADIFNEQVTNELAKRGYDLSTLKFSVERFKGMDKWVIEKAGVYWADDDWIKNPRYAKIYNEDQQIEADQKATELGGKRERLYTAIQKSPYFQLYIKAKNENTEIWLSDEEKNLIQKAVGELKTNIIKGTYLFYFGLNGQENKVELQQNTAIQEK